LTATLHILSACAAQGLLQALQPAFEEAHGCMLQGRFGAVGAMKEALLAGTPCDVFISTQPMIDELAAAGRLRAGGRVLGRVRTGIAVREGDATPAIGSRAELARALAAAPALYFPDPERATAGIHFARVLGELGLAESTRARWCTFPNGATAMRELASAPAAAARAPAGVTGPSGATGAIGCAQQSEILITRGVRLVGPLPKPFELATVYSAAVAESAAVPDLAARLVAWMSDPAQRELRQRCGFEP
jgi:molybdate transport system substrate-binding protein